MQVRYQKDAVSEQLQCYHCGEKYAASTNIKFDDKDFCCEGCKLVYELLNENNLCTYYSLNNSPGISISDKNDSEKFGYLDNEEVNRKLIHFREKDEVHVTFYIPKMHCSSCIWLLENLPKINPAIISSRVNFLKKEVTIIYDENAVKLSAVVKLLVHIGYEPLISLNDLEQKKIKKSNKKEIIKIGIAGFCFGNIMMMSFPEYFSMGNFYGQAGLKTFFSFLNLFLSLPVLFYCASEFFVSAWKGIKQRFLNIDLPIAFAILVTFTRSLYEIVSATGTGYLDSMTGIVFFMLIGRYFQNITYETLSFDRDYKSYFPVSVSLLTNNKETSVPVSQLKRGNIIMARNNDLIPADSILKSDHTYIDYSFVTGESRPVKKMAGEIIYAGGRQLQGAVQLEIIKEVSQSYLTGLWNKDAGTQKSEESNSSFITQVSKYFTMVLFTIAIFAFCYWMSQFNIHKALNALTSVLIVACPCALLLSATFTNGNMLRIFGRNKFYIKNALVIERLAGIDTIVFDKTGTITQGSSISFIGKKLNEEEHIIAVSLASNSAHPLSRKICEQFPLDKKNNVSSFEELQGQGIKGFVNGQYAIMGSEYFVTGKKNMQENSSSKVFFALDGKVLGYFSINNSYRKEISATTTTLKKEYHLHLLSGDNDAEKETLKNIFGDELHFDQKPEEKSAYIKSLQSNDHKVLMLGDGLNDAGALLQSDVGVAVSDDTNNFSPSCDAILDGSSFGKLKSFLDFSKSGKKIITASFIMSVIYNLVGLFFAVQGTLSPVIAAILMPVSSISIVLLTTVSSNLIARIKGL
ncbi:MAG: heavy metal translocating P-type ATPase [Bacteroidia bacterium]